jgi:hypothetical protein
LIPEQSEVEFFAIDFGIHPVKVCCRCGSEFLSQQVMAQIESEVRKRGLFDPQWKTRV